MGAASARGVWTSGSTARAEAHLGRSPVQGPIAHYCAHARGQILGARANGVRIGADVTTELVSLLVIAAIAAFVPLVVGLLRLRVAEVVLLLCFGVIAGPQVLGWITIDDAISLLSELGLGVLFFLAGLELEKRAVTGRSGRLAAAGWIASFTIASVAALFLASRGQVANVLAVAIALTSTALGTLLPIVRDRGELNSRFGTFFMGAGAWGELGPILAMSILLSARTSFGAVVTLAVFAGIAALLAVVPGWFAKPRVQEILDRGHGTSSQTALRFTVLLLVSLLAIASVFELDVVLGAFLAGIVARRFAPPSEGSRLQIKVEAIGFGLFIPLFFVISGARLDIRSIVENPAPLFVAFVLIVLARALPQWFIYRRAIPNPRTRARFSLYVGTGLPIIVAVTTLEVNAGVMTTADAAMLVGAGALTVLVFPLIGNAIDRRSPANDAGAFENATPDSDVS